MPALQSRFWRWAILLCHQSQVEKLDKRWMRAGATFFTDPLPGKSYPENTQRSPYHLPDLPFFPREGAINDVEVGWNFSFFFLQLRLKLKERGWDSSIVYWLESTALFTLCKRSSSTPWRVSPISTAEVGSQCSALVSETSNLIFPFFLTEQKRSSNEVSWAATTSSQLGTSEGERWILKGKLSN